MRLRTIAIILLTLCFCFAGSNTAFAKSKHHAKGVTSSQKIGHRVASHKAAKHKKLAKHSVSSHIVS